jgi:hypothetical protein
MSRLLTVVFLASSMLLACTGNSQTSSKKNTALQNSRYYVFGIHMVPGPKADSIYRAYGVKIVSSSCVLDKKKLAVNQRVDSMMLAVHHKDMSSILSSGQ